MTQMDMRDLLPKMPKAHWDAFFLIGVFPAASPVRWLKLHMFVGADRVGRVPIAALEGMGGEGETFEAVCLKDRVFFHHQSTTLDAVRARLDPFSLGIPGRFEIQGTWPAFTLDVVDATHELRGQFSLEAQDRMQWCNLGNVLTYFGLHSSLKGKFQFHGKTYPLEGLGILEHAWGTDTRIPLPRLLKGFWHWDVLWFGSPAEPHAAVAALAVSPLGSLALPFRGGGRVPGESFQRYRGLKVDYLETRDIGGGMAPVRWNGVIENRLGRISYTARAAGPVLQPFEHGAFLGFTFEGSYETRSGSARPIEGTGFTEFADAGGHSARIAKGRW